MSTSNGSNVGRLGQEAVQSSASLSSSSSSFSSSQKCHQVADQSSDAPDKDNVQHPGHPRIRYSIPLCFQEPLPATVLGRFVFHLREIYYIAAHLVLMLIYGIHYDMTPEELEQMEAREKARALYKPPPRDDEMVMLGCIRDTYCLLYDPNDSTSTVVLGRPSDFDYLDAIDHAVKTYAYLGASATDKQSRLIKYTGPSVVINCDSLGIVRSLPTFERAPYGSVQSFIWNMQSYPALVHHAIPPSAAQAALPFHWLLNLASAISFLHSHNVAHCAPSLDLVWLRADFSAALFDLTGSVFVEYSKELDSNVAVWGQAQGWSWFPFPSWDMDPRYTTSTMPEDAMEYARARDVFNFGTVAWRILTRAVEGNPEWVMSGREKQEQRWSLPELRERLCEAVGMTREKGRYEPPGMEVVRKCWTLEYRNGGEVLEALKKAVLKTGLKIHLSDEVEGVTEAMEQFKGYVPKSYLGDDKWSSGG